jgi:immune inhibitor A
VFWTLNGVPKSYPSGDLQARDATFDVDQTEALHMTRESATGGTKFDVDAHPSVPVFDDSDPDAYWDDFDFITEWFSVRTAGVGSMIQVLSSDESNGAMVVKAGKRFVAVTKAVSISGTPAVGQTLTAVAPTFFQSGVATTYQWLVNGQPVAGATGTTYQVKPADSGKKITVMATGTLAGYDAGSSVSAPAGAQSAKTLVTVDAPKKVKQGKKIKLTATVTDAGAVPTGEIEVTYKGKVVASGTLVNGTVKLKLPKMSKPGAKKLVVSFVPDAGFEAASTEVTVKVKRKRHR